jgi:hypothetical protein
MPKFNETLDPADDSMTAAVTGVFGKPTQGFKPQGVRTRGAGWGFTVPALVVCAALWFLLSGSRLF